MQIRSIVVYSHHGERHEIRLDLNKTNIITGRRSTGKTALTRLIEYCLGSSRAVTGAVIRRSVSWYGLLLQMEDDTRLFVARREPGPGHQTSTDFYVDTGLELEVPPVETLEPNISTTDVVAMIASRIGLPFMQAEMPEESTRTPYRIRLSHALFFNILRDDELVKATQLFHRQDEPYVDNAIRDVLLYFVGALSEDRVPLARELQTERAKLRRLERELRFSAAPDGAIDRGAIDLVAEARAQGFLKDDAGDPIAQLESIDLRSDPKSYLEGVLERIDAVQSDRDELLHQQRLLRGRIETLHNLRYDEAGVVGELDAQRARLSSIGLAERTSSAVCPLCTQSVHEAVPHVETLRSSLRRITRQLEAMDSSRPQLQSAIAGLERQLSDVADHLRANQAELNSLERQQTQFEVARPSIVAAERTKARIEMFLSLRRRGVDDSSTLAAQLDVAKARARELEERLSFDEVDQRMASMVALIDEDLTRYAQDLNLDHSRSVRLDYKRLTVVANTEEGGERLEAMGGGANAVGYHLAVYGALQKWFRARSRPVPRFVFFDQPTMPYYVNDPELRLPDDDDRRQVELMFRFLLRLSSDAGIQVIVTDHALLTGVEGFVDAVKADWHGTGSGLIPTGWPMREVPSDTKHDADREDTDGGDTIEGGEYDTPPGDEVG